MREKRMKLFIMFLIQNTFLCIFLLLDYKHILLDGLLKAMAE